ncbi:tryptophan-rich sensory protein [Microbacterium sp.]|uniref:tryptophan-rich sensory protein n=1 Tax=Microbacterium sp. TaxID=51671 RepID=UPI003C77AD1C
MDAEREATGVDVARQYIVIATVVFMIVAAMIGTGLFGGTNVRDLQGGALDADATYLAPARPAFAIWTAIYALTIAYAVWQALPSQRNRVRQRAAGWWVALTAILNGGWLLAAQFLTLVWTVVAIIALLAALAWTLHQLQTYPGVHFTDILFFDGAVGLHLGWVTLATVANVSAWLTAAGVDGGAPEVWSVLVVVAVGVLGLALAIVTRGRIAVGLAMAWGLFWIGVARTDDPVAPAITAAAWIAAAIVGVFPVVLTILRARQAPD